MSCNLPEHCALKIPALSARCSQDHAALHTLTLIAPTAIQFPEFRVFHEIVKRKIHAGQESVYAVQKMPFEKVDLNKGHRKNKNKREYRHAITLLELILSLGLTVRVGFIHPFGISQILMVVNGSSGLRDLAGNRDTLMNASGLIVAGTFAKNLISRSSLPK